MNIRDTADFDVDRARVSTSAPTGPCGHRPIRASLDPGVQIAKVRFEIQPVVPPRNPVDPWGGVRADRPIRLPQTIDADVMKERSEPHIPVLPRHLAHTIQIA